MNRLKTYLKFNKILLLGREQIETSGLCKSVFQSIKNSVINFIRSIAVGQFQRPFYKYLFYRDAIDVSFQGPI